MCAKTTGRDWTLRVNDILACIEKIQRYTAGLTLDQFRSDQMIVDAVIRNFEIIGEAAGSIPETIQEKYPELAWLEMRGMRNIMIHEYFGVSLPIIWHTITYDLSPLAEGLKQLLESEET